MAASCQTIRTANPTITSHNLGRVMTLPDAEKAAVEAPYFYKDTLKTINALELEIKEMKAERGK